MLTSEQLGLGEEAAGRTLFYTAGEKGRLRVWDLQSGQCIREQPEGVHHEATLTDALYVNF